MHTSRLARRRTILVALAPDGHHTEAHRDLVPEPSGYCCPYCRHPVHLKRGRVKVAHFAHAAGADCPAASEPESPEHLAAKALLAAEFRALGYDVILERPHPQHRRRVDVAVRIPGRAGPVQVAVEVQASAINTKEIIRRERADRAAGYLSTLWCFTRSRAPELLTLRPDIEVRVPEEIRFIHRTHTTDVALLDVNARTLWLAHLAGTWRDGNSWFDSSGNEQSSRGRRPRTIRTVERTPATFALRPVWVTPPKQTPRWVAAFTPDTATDQAHVIA
ncbi:competence protein CoiA [Streptomyces sp. NPDC059875]|uniref:competence protein CoiA n=1 Tax=unclassified Streptomyces TaxID=2593676 RepID=UPI00366A2986